MLQRDPAGALVDEDGIRLRERAPAEHHEATDLARLDAEHVGGELDGVDVGGGHPGVAQPRGGGPDAVTQVGHARDPSSASAASLAASSASSADCTTGSRSPSSTESRL